MIRKLKFAGHEYIAIEALKEIAIVMELKESIHMALNMSDTVSEDISLSAASLQATDADITFTGNIKEQYIPQSIDALKVGAAHQSRMFMIPERYFEELPPEQDEHIQGVKKI